MFRDTGITVKNVEQFFQNNDFEEFKKHIKYDIFKNGQEFLFGHSLIQNLEYPEDEEDRSYWRKNNFVIDTSVETTGIQYDKENSYLKYMEKDGISFFEAACGGDWENPIMFFIYWSESEQRLKGFFPIGDGNTYNTELSCARGTEEQILDSDDVNYEKNLSKYEAQREKFDENYHKNWDKAFKIGFGQLKKVLFS